MGMVFKKTSTQYTKLLPREDADGKVWLQVQAHGDLTALTPYKVIANEYGWITAALADDQKYYYIGVPAAAISSGSIGWVQIGGYVEDVVTASLSVSVGHAFDVYDSAVADQGADYSGEEGEFAVCTEASTTSTTQHMMLIPRIVRGTT